MTEEERLIAAGKTLPPPAIRLVWPPSAFKPASQANLEK